MIGVAGAVSSLLMLAGSVAADQSTAADLDGPSMTAVLVIAILMTTVTTTAVLAFLTIPARRR
jgi:hypothetical protein